MCRIIDAIHDRGLAYALGDIVRRENGDAMMPDLYGMLERDGIALGKKSLYDTVCVFDAIIHITCGGSARLGHGGKSITIESACGDHTPMPWITILEGLLRRRGCRTRTVRGISMDVGNTDDNDNADRNSEKTHIHLD